MSSDEQQELFGLISAVCDEVASDADVARLSQKLNDPEARRIYLNYVDLNFELADQLSMLPAAAPAEPRKFRYWWAVAAAAVVLLGVAILRTPQQATAASTATAALAPAAAAPAEEMEVPAAPIGHVLPIDNGILAETESELAIAAGQTIALGESPTALQIGKTRVYAAGPGELRVDADNALRLEAGRVLAVSGEGEAGFLIATPHCQVTDLGTVFTVETGPLGTSTQVIEGSVEVDNGDESHTLLPGGHLFQAADPANNALNERDLAPFRSLLELSAGGVVSQGELTPLPSPAGFLSDSIRVWSERAGVTLSEVTQLNFVKPGKHGSFPDRVSELAIGTRVDSYMVFYRPNRRKGKFSQSGIVRFPRKIVGVICGNRLLEVTDPVFADPMRPDTTLSRIFIASEDHVTIGPDQQSLKLRLTNSAAFSTKIRVLLAAK